MKLTPKGGRDALQGWMEGPDGAKILKARVSAPPEDGKANRALIALLAKSLDVARSSLRIVAGETARTKIIEVDGDAKEIARRLEMAGMAK